MTSSARSGKASLRRTRVTAMGRGYLPGPAARRSYVALTACSHRAKRAPRRGLERRRRGGRPPRRRQDDAGCRLGPGGRQRRRARGVGAATRAASLPVLATSGARTALGGDLARPGEVRRRRGGAAVHVDKGAALGAPQGAAPPRGGPPRRRRGHAGAGAGGSARPRPKDRRTGDAPPRAALGESEP